MRFLSSTDPRPLRLYPGNAEENRHENLNRLRRRQVCSRFARTRLANLWRRSAVATLRSARPAFNGALRILKRTFWVGPGFPSASNAVATSVWRPAFNFLRGVNVGPQATAGFESRAQAKRAPGSVEDTWNSGLRCPVRLGPTMATAGPVMSTVKLCVSTTELLPGSVTRTRKVQVPSGSGPAAWDVPDVHGPKAAVP